MPIYEFKCNKCEEFFETLIMGGSEDKDVKCPKCASVSFERVLSSTNYAMDAAGVSTKAASQTTRTCSSGNCTTYEIPGHSR